MPNPVFLTADGLTDIGRKRQNNEDAWWVGQFPGAHLFMDRGEAPLQFELAAGPVMLLVSDGVGGANAGEVASRMAAEGIAGELRRTRDALVAAGSAREAILSAVVSTNNAITSKARESGFEGMCATLSLLCFGADGMARWQQVGDSRIYLSRRGQLRQLSRDHSPVGRLRHEGVLSEAEARSHPLRNQIDQSLGDSRMSFLPEGGEEPFQPGDVFLVCSDGLSDGLWDRQIGDILSGVKSPDLVRPCLDKLVANAKSASGRDNITALLALVEPRRRTIWGGIVRKAG